MYKRYTLLLCALAMLLLPYAAQSQLSNYIFQYSGGATAYDMNGSQVAFDGAGQAGTGQGGFVDQSAGTYPIGFTFDFGGTAYTQFSISSNGLMGLGPSVVTASGSNYLTGAGSYPVLAPFWDFMRLSGGAGGCGRPLIHYKMGGNAPSRVLVVEWRDIDLAYRGPRFGTFQVRIYETSNRIEFWYGRMSTCDVCGRGYGCTSTSASIGIAASPSSFISITPTPSGPVSSDVSSNDYVDLNSVPTNAGDLYIFIACGVQLTGRTGPGNGGTATMADGDTFFTGLTTQVGNSAVYRPFVQNLSDPGCSGTMTLTISGPAASDYYFGTPGTLSRNVTLGAGARDTAAITFTPTATGVRNATLVLSGPAGFVRTYNLAATAPLVNYTGNVPQGGTTNMMTGDTLLAGLLVPRHTSQCFTPFSLTNISPSSQLIDYTINDPSGQYTISPDTTLGAGGTTMPIVCFTANGFGPQRATLVVNAGGEIRTFTLNAISAAPGGDLRANGAAIDSSAQLFRNVYGCVGEEVQSIPITMVNTGYGDFSVEKVEFYQIDSVYGQGVPKYPYLRDAQDRLIPSYEYILTDAPARAPYSANVLNYPISVPQGGQRTIYLTFIGARAGKRFAHAVIRTNGQSLASPDTNGIPVDGLISFDLYARGNSALLSDRVGGGLPRAVDFGENRVGELATRFLQLINNGTCPLRINLTRMEIVAGDVDEFEIVTKPSSTIDPTTNDLVLAPGATDRVELRFKATHQGSRRAGLRLVTSDSTIVINGITERGNYYVDLYGMGKADLYSEGADLGQALIGGDATEHRHGVIRFKNTRAVPVTISAIAIEGTDAGEFIPDASNAWPTLPKELQPGEILELGVEFAPVAGGAVGERVAQVHLTTGSGESAIADLKGLAGSRTIAVNPTTLNFSVTTGGVARQTVTIANSGTMPLKITKVDASSNPDYTVGTLPRTELAPQQVEYLEVTFTPQGPGVSAGTLNIESNGTNGTQAVTLNGTASTKRKADDPSSATVGRPGFSGERQDAVEEFSVSGVTGVRDATGLSLMQSVPNPGRDIVEIGWLLPHQGELTLSLYDGAGRLIRVLESGAHASGAGQVRVDVSGLASGVYHYRLTVGDRVLSRTLTVAH